MEATESPPAPEDRPRWVSASSGGDDGEASPGTGRTASAEPSGGRGRRRRRRRKYCPRRTRGDGPLARVASRGASAWRGGAARAVPVRRPCGGAGAAGATVAERGRRRWRGGVGRRGGDRQDAF